MNYQTNTKKKEHGTQLLENIPSDVSWNQKLFKSKSVLQKLSFLETKDSFLNIEAYY